jgi:hypothetical protein
MGAWDNREERQQDGNLRSFRNGEQAANSEQDNGFAECSDGQA